MPIQKQAFEFDITLNGDQVSFQRNNSKPITHGEDGNVEETLLKNEIGELSSLISVFGCKSSAFPELAHTSHRMANIRLFC